MAFRQWLNQADKFVIEHVYALEAQTVNNTEILREIRGYLINGQH